MLEPGRSYSIGNQYRYGFSGKEQDNEISGQGNQYDYGFRIYNPRLGRFLSVDPLTGEYPWNSTYAFAEDDVIRSIDLEGAEKHVQTFAYAVANGETVSKVVSNDYHQPEGTSNPYHSLCPSCPMTTEETVANGFVRANHLPADGIFSFFVFAQELGKENYARYEYTDPGGKQQVQYFDAGYVDFMYNFFEKEQDQADKILNIGGALLGAAVSATLLKGELNAATGELKALKVETKAATTNLNTNEALAAKYKANRPKQRQSTINKVWEDTKKNSLDGNVYDPNTGELLKWDKFKSRFDQWHMGHKPGHEYSTLIDKLRNGVITEKQFLEEYHNPDNYQPEAPGSNMSHKYEQKPRK